MLILKIHISARPCLYKPSTTYNSKAKTTTTWCPPTRRNFDFGHDVSISPFSLTVNSSPRCAPWTVLTTMQSVTLRKLSRVTYFMWWSTGSLYWRYWSTTMNWRCQMCIWKICWKRSICFWKCLKLLLARRVLCWFRRKAERRRKPNVSSIIYLSFLTEFWTMRRLR